MVCGSRLAKALGRIGDTEMQRQSHLLAAVHLPVEVPAELRSMPDDILNCMLLDKKTVAGDLRFVLPDSIGHVETIGGIDSDRIVACLDG